MTFVRCGVYLETPGQHLCGWRKTAGGEAGRPLIALVPPVTSALPVPPAAAQRENMTRIALVLTLLGIATNAFAIGVQGNVLKTNGQPCYPCDIDIFNRQTNQPVIIAGDSTQPNGHYNLVLPNGRYDLVFKPGPTSHTFQGTFDDARVESNTVTVNMSLPMGQYFKGK